VTPWWTSGSPFAHHLRDEVRGAADVGGSGVVRQGWAVGPGMAGGDIGGPCENTTHRAQQVAAGCEPRASWPAGQGSHASRWNSVISGDTALTAFALEYVLHLSAARRGGVPPGAHRFEMLPNGVAGMFRSVQSPRPNPDDGTSQAIRHAAPDTADSFRLRSVTAPDPEEADTS
jgi:hypothetical protein